MLWLQLSSPFLRAAVIAFLYKDVSCLHLQMHRRGSNLEQIEDLLAQVQLEVGVVGARHVVDEDQAVPLGLKAVDNQGIRQSINGSHKHLSF